MRSYMAALQVSKVTTWVMAMTASIIESKSDCDRGTTAAERRAERRAGRRAERRAGGEEEVRREKGAH